MEFRFAPNVLASAGCDVTVYNDDIEWLSEADGIFSVIGDVVSSTVETLNICTLY